MTISIYMGQPGSGKSYESMEGVILPAITPTRKKSRTEEPLDYTLPESWTPGRNVITNLEGIRTAEARQFVADRTGAPIETVGKITAVDRDDFEQKGFFPSGYKTKFENNKPVLNSDGRPVKIVDDTQSTVKGGDLVVIDEAWSLLGTGMRLTKEQFAFMREHRHFVHPETGVSCDVVLLTQHCDDIVSSVKRIVANTYEMKKHTDLGSEKRYVVRVYRGTNLRYFPERTEQKTYDPEIYALYDSYGGGKGQERVVDRRSVLWNDRKFWIKNGLYIGAAVVGLGLAFFVVLPGMTGAETAKKTGSQSPTATSNGPPATSPGGVKETPATPNGTNGPIPAATTTTGASEWRIAGSITRNEITEIILISRTGQTRRESPSLFTMRHGKAISGRVDGRAVSPWRFDAPASSSPLPATMLPSPAKPQFPASVPPGSASPPQQPPASP